MNVAPRCEAHNVGAVAVIIYVITLYMICLMIMMIAVIVVAVNIILVVAVIIIAVIIILETLINQPCCFMGYLTSQVCQSTPYATY